MSQIEERNDSTYSVDTDKLLEKHDSNTNHCPANNVRAEHVDPCQSLELELRDEALGTRHFRVTPDESFSVVNCLGADGDPLCLHAGVFGRHATDVA